MEALGNSHEIAYDWEVKDGTKFFYHVHEDCYFTSYDENQILGAFSKQMQQGENMLTVRFEKDEDYQKAKNWQTNDWKDMNRILSEIGYFGGYRFWANDTMKTVHVGLYDS